MYMILLLIIIHFNAIFSNACHALTLNVASTSLRFQVDGWTLKNNDFGKSQQWMFFKCQSTYNKRCCDGGGEAYYINGDIVWGGKMLTG